MTELQHTTIQRGGETARKWTRETSDCGFDLNIAERGLEFRFKIASKGGGFTEVLLTVGLEDLPVVLEAIANGIPDSIGTLSRCTALASTKCLELLATPITPLAPRRR